MLFTFFLGDLIPHVDVDNFHWVTVSVFNFSTLRLPSFAFHIDLCTHNLG